MARQTIHDLARDHGVDEAAVRRLIDGASRRRRLRWAAGTIVAIALVVVSAVALRAQSAGDIAGAALPYHGYLEQGGVPVDGKRYITFRIYNGDGSPTGWSESQTVVVAAGHFSALLGTQAPLDGALRTGVAPLSIGVTVQDVAADGAPTGTPAALAGRQLLASAPYARRGAPGKDFAVDGTLTAAGAAQIGGAVSAASAAVSGDLSVGSSVHLPDASGGTGWSVQNRQGNLELQAGGQAQLQLSTGGRISGATLGFGGMFQVGTAGPCAPCQYANPYTQACSCPSGFVEVRVGGLVFGNANTDHQCNSEVVLCTR